MKIRMKKKLTNGQKQNNKIYIKKKTQRRKSYKCSLVSQAFVKMLNLILYS